ncbi:head-tail connector protein [Shimia sagamensis]|uniref:Phage gp6-like head-tail connector protein n=1 Tax=Shimia sagamensis TaxID=1566352 RepID=A0ABY1PDT4_9RHOB|nr:head-tail connector protein [Shimia sagamensis]SMP32156.1 uncharacterized phage protein (possible DNA packaging)/phage conserved hypothetical protein, phiE125 gp8 family [Shimia sagamensis]
MSKPDLDALKQVVTATDFDDDDDLLTSFLDAACAHVETFLRRNLATDFPGGWPKPIAQAALLLAAHFYEHRGQLSEASESGMPTMVKDLLAGYRSLA